MVKTMIALRVTLSYVNIELLKKLVDKRSQKYLSCLEKKGTEKEHVHYVIDTDFTKSTIRKDLKKILSECGNMSYSMKVIKDDVNKHHALVYACKGKAENDYILFHSKGYPINEHKDFNKEYWIKNKQLKKNTNNKGTPLFMKIFDEYKTRIEDFYMTIPSDKSDDGIAMVLDNYIRRLCIQYYMKHIKVFPNPYYLRCMSMSITAHSLNKIGHYKGVIENAIFHMMYPLEQINNNIDFDKNLYFDPLQPPPPYKRYKNKIFYIVYIMAGNKGYKKKKKIYRKRRYKKKNKRESSFMRVKLRKTGTQVCTATSTSNSQKFKLDDFGSKSKFTSIYEQYRIVEIKQTIYPTSRLSANPMTTAGTSGSDVVDVDQVQNILEMLLGVKIDRDDVNNISDLDDCLKNPNIRIYNLGSGKPVTVKFKPNILVPVTNSGNQSMQYDNWLDCEASSDEEYYGLNKLYHVSGASASFPITFRLLTTATVEFKRFRTDE